MKNKGRENGRSCMGPKSIRRIFTGLLSAVMVFSGLLFVSAETAGKSTENFGDLVVFVQFDDSTAENFMETADTYSSETYAQKAGRYFLDSSTYNKSLRNYLSAVSYGQFSVSVTMPQYSSGTIVPIKVSSSLKTNEYSLVKTVSEKVDAMGVSGDAIDRDGDGYVDNLTIITDQGSDTQGSELYPHKSAYEGTDSISGRKIYNYNIYDAETAFGSGSIEKEGVIIHEFMHSIGFPDLYDYSGATEPVGSWDIMSQASTFAQYPLAYMRKYVKGWLSIGTISSTQKGLTLVPSSEAHGNQAYILKSPLSDTEFFVVEYRKKNTDMTGLDYKIPGSGLIVYRINTSVSGLTNKKGEPGVYILGQDAAASSTGAKFDTTYLSKESGRTSFGSTDPAYAGTGLTFSDGSNSGIMISNVGSAGDTISFDVDFADTSGSDIWKVLGGTKASDASAGEIGFAENGSTKYVLYTADNESGISKAYVAVYSGGKYSVLGSSAASSDGVYDASAVCLGGVPYVIYKESSRGDLRIAAYENGKWQSPVTIQTGWSGKYAAVAGSDGIYILKASGENENAKYDLIKYNGSGYSTVRSDIASGMYEPSMSMDGSTIYMSFRDAVNNRIVIRRLASGTLSEISSDISGNTGKTAFSNGMLYVAAGTLSDGIHLWKYSSGSWTECSDKFNSGTTAAYDLKAYGGTVFLAAADQKSGKTSVWYEDSSGKWIAKANDIDKTAVSSIVLGADNDSVYAAYLSSSGDASYPTVKFSAQVRGTSEDPTAPTEPVVKPVTPPVVTPTKPVVTPVKKVTPPPRVTPVRFSISRTKVTVRWKKASGATYYEVYRSLGKNGRFRKVATVSSKRTYWVNTKLRRNTTYTYRIRAVKKIGSRVYCGTMSRSVFVKTKR